MTDLASKIEDLLDEVAGETRSKKATSNSRDKDGDVKMESDGGSDRSSRRGKRSEERRRRPSPDRRGGGGGDFWEPNGGRTRRSVSRDDDRWRPGSGGRVREPREHRERDDYRERDRDRGDRGHRSSRGYDGGRRRRSGSPRARRPQKSMSPELNDDERDRRTIFVQQLAARLRTKELTQFFEKVGPVKEAQIVKDRVSGRSKGYVNF
jgi:RNA-binding protein 39